MKQGRASSNTQSGQKREPNAHAVSECAVADIGIQQVYTRSEPLYEGRGFEAPKAGSSTHRSGSQGKH